MEIKNNVLVLTREELINMISNDNTDSNDTYKEKILSMINNFIFFSDKQEKWIYSKILYITNHNEKYKDIRKMFNSFTLE